MTRDETRKLMSTPRGRKKLNLYYIIHEADVTKEQRMTAADDLASMIVKDARKANQ